MIEETIFLGQVLAKFGYINIPSLNTGSVSKSVYGSKNPKKLKDAIKKASETLDELYVRYLK